MATLIVRDGPAAGQQFLLGEHSLVMIGRDEQCTFQIVDGQMSRRHLQVKRRPDGSGHCVIDHGSSNGVQVNGTRIEQETPLNNGDFIRAGETVLIYSTVDSPDAKTMHSLMRHQGEYRQSTMCD